MNQVLIKPEPSLLIDGPAGKLEVIQKPGLNEPRAIWGIVCHPHPLFGGTMHNKVVTTLVKTFQSLGLATIQFNFRGVMRSEGVFDNGNGELDDLLAVINWAEQQEKKEIWLAGFSFGAYIAAKAATQLPIGKLVTVAPPVEHFPMKELPPITCPWILAQGELDEVVPAEEVLAWAYKRTPQPIILKFPNATHFFHGQLTELKKQLEDKLK